MFSIAIPLATLSNDFGILQNPHEGSAARSGLRGGMVARAAMQGGSPRTAIEEILIVLIYHYDFP